MMHDIAVMAMTFSRDGEMLATGDTDGVVKVRGVGRVEYACFGWLVVFGWKLGCRREYTHTHTRAIPSRGPTLVQLPTCSSTTPPPTSPPNQNRSGSSRRGSASAGLTLRTPRVRAFVGAPPSCLCPHHRGVTYTSTYMTPTHLTHRHHLDGLLAGLPPARHRLLRRGEPAIHISIHPHRHPCPTQIPPKPTTTSTPTSTPTSTSTPE